MIVDEDEHRLRGIRALAAGRAARREWEAAGIEERPYHFIVIRATRTGEFEVAHPSDAGGYEAGVCIRHVAVGLGLRLLERDAGAELVSGERRLHRDGEGDGGCEGERQ